MPQPLGTKTVGDVITWVTEQFGDVANVQIDTPKIIRYINMAVLEITTRDPKAYHGRYTQNSVIGQNEYSYPTGLLYVTGVKYDTSLLKTISFEEIQRQTGDSFTTEKGTPQYWSQQADYFQLWPVPDAVKTVTVYGSAKPANVTVSGDLLPLSDRFFPRICEYVEAKANELDEDYETAAAKMTRFEDMLKVGQNAEDSMQGTYPLFRDPEEECI